MLRQAGARLLRQGARAISTSTAQLQEGAGIKEFLETWQKVAPSTMAPPELPSTFLEPKATGEATTAADGDKVAVNFYTPTGLVAEAKVRSDLQLGLIDGRIVFQDKLTRNTTQSKCLNR